MCYNYIKSHLCKFDNIIITASFGLQHKNKITMCDWSINGSKNHACELYGKYNKLRVAIFHALQHLSNAFVLYFHKYNPKLLQQ